MSHVTSILRRFRNEERGSVAVETILIIPMLFWVYLTMFSVFHAYRHHSINQKAAYTIGDIISRETTPIDNSYMQGTRELLGYLTTTNSDDVAIRLTSVKYDAVNDVYKRDWSRKRGWVPLLTNNAVAAMKDQLPVMPHNERIMVVETFAKYETPFNTGLGDSEIRNYVFTRPRYAPRVLFTDD